MAEAPNKSVGGHSGLRGGVPPGGRDPAEPARAARCAGRSAPDPARRRRRPAASSPPRINARAVVEIGTGMRRVRAVAAARHAPGRRAHQRRRRGRAPAAGPADLRRGRLLRQPGPADHRAVPSTCSPASPTAATTWSSATATSRSTPTTSPRPSGCCAPAASSPSTTRCWHDRVADPAQRDPDTVADARAGQASVRDERLRPLLLPVGDGLLAAVKLDCAPSSAGPGRAPAPQPARP